MTMNKNLLDITHEYYIKPGDVHRSKWPDPNASDELHPSLGLLTLCVIVLADGSTITGEHRATSVGFDDDLGRKAAKENAIKKMAAS